MKNVSMRKKFSDYKAYVFDLDGTLYYQKKLRLIMAGRLAGYYACHFWKLKELFIVKRFREVREKWPQILDSGSVQSDNNTDVDGLQYEFVAMKMNTSAQNVEAVVKRWIYDNPLDAVAASKDSIIADIIFTQRNFGKKVIIFSDYQTEDKLKSLDIEVDGQYCSADSQIGELKPSPKGLMTILEDYNLNPEDIIMVGDRMEKDGECAKAASVDYIILPRSKSKRDYGFFTV